MINFYQVSTVVALNQTCDCVSDFYC